MALYRSPGRRYKVLKRAFIRPFDLVASVGTEQSLHLQDVRKLYMARMMIYKPVTELNVMTALEDCLLPDSAKALNKLYIDSQQIHSQRTNSVV